MRERIHELEKKLIETKNQDHLRRLIIAAERAFETYTADNAPNTDLVGTYIVATAQYERLGDLEDAVQKALLELPK